MLYRERFFSFLLLFGMLLSMVAILWVPTAVRAQTIASPVESTIANIDTEIQLNGSGMTYITIFEPGGEQVCWINTSSMPQTHSLRYWDETDCAGNKIEGDGLGEYHFVANNGTTCVGWAGSYEDCIASAYYADVDVIVTVDEEEPSATSSTVTLVSTNPWFGTFAVLVMVTLGMIAGFMLTRRI